MKVLFLTLMKIISLSDEGIYMDLMREFGKHGHEVIILSPLEKKEKKKSELLEEGRLKLLRCKTGNLFGVGMIEKALSQSLLPFHYKKAIKRFLKEESFDLILYSTPPITLASMVKKIKKQTGAVTYLMLKDIFPQNAVDIGLLSPFLASLLFRRKEKELYRISDFIGCMSPANVTYLLSHNDLPLAKVGICPNSISVRERKESRDTRHSLGERYGFDEKKLLFLYGGNLGKPQDIPFLLQCIEAMKEEREFHFIVCGTGTESARIKTYMEEKKSKNLTWISGLPKNEYDELVQNMDVGMIVLDHRFTIPNFPSRLLSYMEKELPVLICTDEASDMGRIAEEADFGLFTPSNSVESFKKTALRFRDDVLRKRYGKNARNYLENHYTVEKSYQAIIEVVLGIEEREG